LHAALGDAPDIVLIGQLRDLETLAIAIETAEKEAYMKAVDTVQIVSSLQSRGIDTSFVE
jgi:Tfp pilus assembly pilus retraction ATPase PilT